MKIEDFIESRLTSGVCVPSEEDIKYILEYVKSFNCIEILEFAMQLSFLSNIAKDSLLQEDLSKQANSLYSLIRMIETIKEGREMLREVLRCKNSHHRLSPNHRNYQLHIIDFRCKLLSSFIHQ